MCYDTFINGVKMFLDNLSLNLLKDDKKQKKYSIKLADYKFKKINYIKVVNEK